MPRETLQRLLTLDLPTHFIAGNGELAVLAQIGVDDPHGVTYSGTTSGEPLSGPLQDLVRWTAHQIHSDYAVAIESWPKTLRLTVEGCGEVLFCHGTPRSEVECFTRLTHEDRLIPIFEGTRASVVVCGHTHMQFDRMIGSTRVINAGSVGMPFGDRGADWLLLGPLVELRHTIYDLNAAAERIRATSYPGAGEFASSNVLNPPSEEQMLAVFAAADLR
jgi:calcineurin-like phosphoesterase family protein